jgi:hypothetical protein
MMKWTFTFLLSTIFLTGQSFGQYFYSWISQNISVHSSVKLISLVSNDEYRLEGNGVVVDFANLKGMENINDLASSLDAYAKTFGYKVTGKAHDILDIKTMVVARLDGQKNGQNLILCLMASKDYKKHFACEIVFPEDQRTFAESLLKGISREDYSEILTTALNQKQDVEESLDALPDDSDTALYETVENSEQQEATKQPTSNSLDKANFSKTPVQKLTWKLLSKYSPDGYFILDELYKSPTSYGEQTLFGDEDFAKWIDGQTEQDIVKSLNTVVHEMDHGFTGRVYLKILKEANQPVEGFGYSAFYLGNKETQLVRHTDVFVSSEINSVYPKNLITSRYQTYIYPSEPIMSSQQSGIYGLLDEWNAYYNGTKTSVDLYQYFKDKHDDASGWIEFFSDYYGTYYAYLEFKSYILEYMIYAQKNHPQIYQGFMNNRDLLYTLRKNDELWKAVINRFKSLKKEIVRNIKAKGVEVEEKDGFIFINDSGIGNFSEIYNKFQEELKKPQYQEIARTLGFEYAGGPEF